MAGGGGQRGTEFALCLNSINRDIETYPEPNDFTLDLKDRYDLQMMVLGSFEFPFNQWTVEEPWSRFSYDVGLSIFSLEGRTLLFNDLGLATPAITMLPAPYLTMRRTSVTSNVYRAQPNRPKPTPHGLGLGSLSAFPPGSVRIFVVPARPSVSARTPMNFAPVTVTAILSPTEVEVESSQIPTDAGMLALLVVASANTRTFRSPALLAQCLQAFCDAPFPGMEFLSRLRFTYDARAMELTLEVLPAPSSHCAGTGHGAGGDLKICTSATNLLSGLSFRLPAGHCYALPQRLSTGDFPPQSGCSAPPRLEARGLPSSTVALEFDVTELPVTCTKRGGAASREPGLCSTCIQIPPANYEAAQLRAVTEHHLNSRHYLEIPPSPASPGAANIYVFGWAQTPAFNVIHVAREGAIASFHPGRIASELSEAFATDANSGLPPQVVLRWTYEDDRFVARPTVASTYFRVVWPQAEGSQSLAFRLSVDESVSMSTELRGRKLNYIPCPTAVTLPLAYGDVQGTQSKRFLFVASPKLAPGNPMLALPPPEDSAYRVSGISLRPYPKADSYVYLDVVAIGLGELPLEVAVVVYSPSEPSTACFGVVACHSSADSLTFIELLATGDPLPRIDAGWRADVLPLAGGALNLYFPRAQGSQWSRLAEIYGFRSGANVFLSNPLIAPAQWNLEAPSYILIDLGLQHMSATITHRCGNSVMSQFFAKIVLYPNFKEVRQTPSQAIGTGVSVVSSLRLRLLNPWHTLYFTHGREWSITVILATGTKAVRAECM